MSVFLLIHNSSRVALRDSIKARFPETFEIDGTALAFKASESAQSIVLAAELSEPEKSDVAVLQLSPDYWGYHKKAFWDWLSAAFKNG